MSDIEHIQKLLVATGLASRSGWKQAIDAWPQDETWRRDRSGYPFGMETDYCQDEQC